MRARRGLRARPGEHREHGEQRPGREDRCPDVAHLSLPARRATAGPSAAGVMVWPTCGTRGRRRDVPRQAGDGDCSGQRGRRQHRRQREERAPARCSRAFCDHRDLVACSHATRSSAGIAVPRRNRCACAAQHAGFPQAGARAAHRRVVAAPASALLGYMSSSVVVVVGNGVSGLWVRQRGSPSAACR